MPESCKIQVRLGDAEFTAEGPEEVVKAAFEHFLRARETVAHASLVPPASPPPPGMSGTPAREESVPQGEVDQELLSRVYQKDGDLVSLRMLPQRTNPNWQADAVILLLYGFLRLANMPDVLVTKLNQGLRTSGIALTRVDHIIEVHSNLYMKGGVRSGGRYTLNNQGRAIAERMLREQFN